MKKYPFPIATAFFIAGILSREIFPGTFLMPSFLLVSAFLMLVFAYMQAKLRLLSCSVLFVFFSMGYLLNFIDHNPLHSEVADIRKKENVVFTLNRKLNSNENNRRYEVDFFFANHTYPAVLSVPKSVPELDFVHYYRAEAYINPVKPRQNDYQFDYRRYLARKGIFYQMYLPGVPVSASMQKIPLNRLVKQKRLETLQKIDAEPEISERAKQLLKGIILADRTEMDAQTVADFNRTGLVHILAISGSHMVIIFFLVYFVLSRIFPASMQRWAIALSLLLIWSFTVFIDYGNSVVRSCIMLTVYYIYVLLQRKPDLIHSMSLAAMLILGWDTDQIFDVGFQLSFAAVFGIYWLNFPLFRLFPYRPDNRILNYILSVVTVTLSAQIATFPLVVYYFHQFPLVSLVANLAAIPVAEGVIIISFLMTGILGVGISGFWLDVLYDKIAVFFLDMVHFFGTFRWGLVENIPMDISEAVVLCLLVWLLKPVLTAFNIKNILRFSWVLLCFIMLRTVLDWAAFRKQEVRRHALYKGKVFSVKKGDKVYFWIPENADVSKTEQYVVKPYLNHVRARNYIMEKMPPHTKKVGYNGGYFEVE
ncbi:ComEC/Rec2 family competence protein [Daejeonia sp. YH14]|uniref:ComEC/Rec2 family competence protein n=1 Tax=Daejeonia sp. YH14 TaxID=3439042 RepID=UPI003F498B43